jgi:outer membrane lipoprotein-sorting protein
MSRPALPARPAPLLAALAVAVTGTAALAAGPAPAKPALEPADLSATAIVERSVATRGGLASWRAVHALSWSGQMEAGGGNRPALSIPGKPRAPAADPAKPVEQLRLPFRYEMQRPRKSRLEIDFQGQTAVQVYDGAQGWKLRPFLNRNDVDPFTAAELEAAASQSGLDGYLVDCAAKGTAVTVEGIEDVEGQPAYRLKLTLEGGAVLHDWVDRKSFLEVRIDGTPRRMDGKLRAVQVYLRDYRNVNGLMVPHLLETTVEGSARTEKIYIEKVQVNPSLDAARFDKPA